jgi:hypothetical protein
MGAGRKRRRGKEGRRGVGRDGGRSEGRKKGRKGDSRVQ